MGVLEDAIREHLDLKRKHGASEEEVERKELEALGPARREFEGGAEEASESEVAVADPEAAEPVVEAPAELPLDPEPEPEPSLPEPEPGPEPEPEPEPVEPPLQEPLAPEPGVADPATTRLHESPAVEPDFAADDEEEAADRSPPRDWDFD
jgi:hypothetical protein